MKRLRPGMRVYAVNDERIGEVAEIRQCCFVVSLTGGKLVTLTQNSIFNVVSEWATLVCDLRSLERYECAQEEHPAPVDEAEPA